MDLLIEFEVAMSRLDSPGGASVAATPRLYIR